MDGVQRVPYRLPQMLAAIAEGRGICVVESEKNASLAWRKGIPATTSDVWTSNVIRWFGDASVAVLPDNDATGANKALRAASALTGIAKRVRIVPLPVTGKGHDIEQWIAAGGNTGAAPRAYRAGPGLRAATF